VSNFSTAIEHQGSIVGLTGGLGSGKSTVSRIFQSIGVPAWDADAAGRSLYTDNRDFQAWIIQHFGRSCGIWQRGELNGIDRKELAAIVFQDDDALDALNRKVHPMVRNAFADWHEKVIQERGPSYVLRESAILFESEAHLDCKLVITVVAEKALRIERVKRRNGWSENEIEARMLQQLNDQDRIKQADFVVDNNTNSPLLQQVLELHQKIQSN
jgi:dephospho-CoA kinase